MQPYRFSDRHRARDTTGATAIYLPPGSIVGPLKCKAQRVASSIMWSLSAGISI